MKIVFVSGQYKGGTSWETEKHIREAEEVALKLWKMNAIAICPHTMTRFFYGEINEEVVVFGLLKLLERCDAMLVISLSTGVFKEIKHASKFNIPVFYDIDDIEKWLSKEERKIK